MEILQADAFEENGLPRRKFFWLLMGILGAFLILVIRLWQLQLLESDTFVRMSDKNRIRLLRIPSTRGIIFDRHGQILADNRASFSLMAVPAELRSLRETLNALRQGIEFSMQTTLGRVQRASKRAPFRPLPLKEGLPWDEVAWVETHRLDLPGIWVEVAPRRSYPYGPVAAHALGYVGEITEEQLRDWRGRGYRLGDRVGQSGLESRLESYLRGRDGGLQVEVDARGRQLMVLQEASFTPGANAFLTLDVDLQKVAEQALGERAGAVVVGDPNGGEILAMVSHPAYDPNIFSTGIPPQAWRDLLKHPQHPLQDRVVGAQYPPGSTYKIITAVAGLEEGVITPETRLYCPGYLRLGSTEFRCWKEEGHGWLRLRDALVQSCDVFFYQVGEKVGVDRLAKYAEGFGFGRPTGLDASQEKTGLVPTTGWKRKRFGEPWHRGDTLSVAIGQSFNLLTPLQQFVAISAVANGGLLMVPWMVRRIEAPDGDTLATFEPQIRGKVPAGPATLQLLKEALWSAVNDPKGTGRRARIDHVAVAGKTGTAQVVGLREDEGESRKKEEAIPYALRDHAWFLCFAPVEDPRIAMAVVVEHGGQGGAVAAPIAKQILQAFFRDERGAP